jgi:hypothetical protein
MCFTGAPESIARICKRFPFERIPKRVFLDTNVINVLVKHCGRVFDRAPIPVDTDPTLAADIEALMHVFYVGARANWDILGSQKTLDELSRTRDSSLRGDLLEYAFGIVNQDLVTMIANMPPILGAN